MSNFPKKHTVKVSSNEKFAYLLRRVDAMQEAFMKMSDINNQNFHIMAMILARTEVLKSKGAFTDEEVKIKFDELEAAKQSRAKSQLEAERAALIAEKEAKSDDSAPDSAGSSVQPEDARNDENHLGSPKLTVLSGEGGGGNSGSGSTEIG